MYEFGTALRKPGIERNGIIIDSIENGQVAGVIFASHNDILFLIPRSIIGQVDRAMLKNMSKSQRLKLHQNFQVGENVDFEADDCGVVTWISRSAPVREITLSSDGHFVFNTVGVLSSEPERRYWTKDCGCVTATAEQLAGVMPNVALNCTVALELDYGEHEGQMQFFLSTFRPKFFFLLHTISNVSLNFDVLYHAPWNKNKFTPSTRARTTSSSSAAEVENVFAASFGNVKTDRNVRCVAVSRSEVYARRYDRQRIRVGFHSSSEDKCFEVGDVLWVNLYACPINGCLIANTFTHEIDKLRAKPDDQWLYKFLVRLEYEPTKGVYSNEFFAPVRDSYGLMSGRSPEATETWIACQYNDNDDTVDFVIVQTGNRKAQIEQPVPAAATAPSSDKNDETESSDSGNDAAKPAGRSREEILAELRHIDREIILEIGKYAVTYDLLQRHDLTEKFFELLNRL